jgi:hypothetical protein
LENAVEDGEMGEVGHEVRPDGSMHLIRRQDVVWSRAGQGWRPVRD